MKRMAYLFVAFTMAFSLAACSSNQTAPSSEAGNSSSLTVLDNSSSSSTLSTSASSSILTSSSASVSSSAPPSTSEQSSVSSQQTDTSGGQPEETLSSSAPEASQPETASEDTPDASQETAGVKVLVAYFSATNTTKGVAEKISVSVGGDLYEITPAEPYTSADLNYHDDNSRSTKEMNDPSARPAISSSVTDMSQYNVVFLGYPIWWGEAPRIVSTFVESYDFSGKTIVPFCTSGGSGMGSSAANLQDEANGANWLSGGRLDGSASQDEITQWVDGLGLDFQ